MDYKERIRALREDNDYTQSRIAGLLNNVKAEGIGL